MKNKGNFTMINKWFVGMECVIIAALIGLRIKNLWCGIAAFFALLCIFCIPIVRGILSILCSAFDAIIVYNIAIQYLSAPVAGIMTFCAFWLFIRLHRKTGVVMDKETGQEEPEPSSAEKYYEQAYYQITHNHYYDMLHDNGKYGEYMIYEKLRNFEKSGGKFLFNCYLDRGNNKTTEIDVLLICGSGIFVFESKNYNGWIYGKGWEKNWTQLFPLGKGLSEKIQFYNPLKQNETHIKYLKDYVGSNIPIFSIVVFADKCTLKRVNTKGSSGYVVQLKQLVSTVNQCKEQTGNVLSKAEILDLYHQLYPYSQASQEVKEKHIQDVQDYKNLLNTNKEENKGVQMLVCPRCGSPMVLRTIKRGKNIGDVFYGCSAFPDCRYTREVPESQKSIE